MIEKANLIVGTSNNHAPLQLSIRGAAAEVLRGGKPPDEPLLNMIEMAFRAYDPCLACATHALPGQLPLEVRVLGPDGRLVRSLRRGARDDPDRGGRVEP